MKPEVLLEVLEGTADQLQIRVTYEPLQSTVVHGGLCRVKGEYRIIIDKRATMEERIATLATALGRFDISELEVPPQVRELVRVHKVTPRTAA